MTGLPLNPYHELDRVLADILYGRVPFDDCLCWTVAHREDMSTAAHRLWRGLILRGLPTNGVPAHPAAPGMPWTGPGPGRVFIDRPGLTEKRRVFIVAFRHWLRAMEKAETAS